MNNKYTFNVSCPNAVDFDEIESELSRERAVAVVTSTGEGPQMFCVLLHSSVTNKTGLARRTPFENRRETGLFLEHVKDVMAQPWPRTDPRRVEVDLLDKSMSHKWAAMSRKRVDDEAESLVNEILKQHVAVMSVEGYIPPEHSQLTTFESMSGDGSVCDRIEDWRTAVVKDKAGSDSL